MEHLPAVLNPNEPVNVPWHGGSFDNGDFEGFASRRRIDLASLQQGQLGDLPKQEAAAFLQAWLYFGLLQQTLQLPVLTDDYVNTTVSGGKLITTGRLREHLRRWKTIYEAEGEKPEQLEMRRLRIVETLDLSYGVWYGFEPGIFADIAGIEVELSIRLLAAAIEHAVLSVSRYSKEITWEPWIQVYETPWRRNLNCNFLRERLKRHGWCPSMFSDTKFRLPMQYFVSLFGPPKRMFHKECTETDKACREVKVVLSEYKTQHVNDDCSCRFLNPPMETVNGIIDDGGIPILYLAQGSDGTEIKVVRQRPELVFTAISHVWADGLGNPANNSLPECQLQKICNLFDGIPFHRPVKPISDCKDEADAIYNDNVWQPRQNVVDPLDTVERFKSQPKYFWIDPLCVPLEPESTQKTAIASMRKVYNRANRVLVLDSDLMSTEIPQLSQSAMVCEEPVTRITMSNWSQRFWTLQEGVLANFLYFQFQNQAIWRPQLSELTDENEVEFCFDNEISYYSSDMDYSWRSGGLVNSRLLQIMQVWRSLARRVTSLPEDMPVCVATLLDISVEKILNVPKEERELKLWGEYGMVPAGVLMHIGPKFEDPRYCWAPRSLEECSRLPQPATVPLHITDDGCEVSLHGFQIDLPHETLPKAVIAFRFDNHVYYIRQNQKFGNKAWKGIDFARHKKLGIILAQIPPQDPDIRPPLVGALATMLSVVGEREDGALLVHYLRAVSVMKEGSQFDKYPNPAWLPEEIEEKKYVIDAIPKGVNQKWFIIPDA